MSLPGHCVEGRQPVHNQYTTIEPTVACVQMRLTFHTCIFFSNELRVAPKDLLNLSLFCSGGYFVVRNVENSCILSLGCRMEDIVFKYVLSREHLLSTYCVLGSVLSTFCTLFHFSL